MKDWILIAGSKCDPSPRADDPPARFDADQVSTGSGEVTAGKHASRVGFPAGIDITLNASVSFEEILLSIRNPPRSDAPAVTAILASGAAMSFLLKYFVNTR